MSLNNIFMSMIFVGLFNMKFTSITNKLKSNKLIYILQALDETKWSISRYVTVFCTTLFLLIQSQPLIAAIDVHEFDSEEKSDRFQGLVQELRCPKCQNQNLADSNSQISIDLRDQVARLVSEGESDAAVKEYMVERYGEFVLYKPPVEDSTLALWWGPGVMFGVAFLVFGLVIYKRANVVDDNE